MANKFCVMSRAAIADETKKAVLSQEVVRRMLNTSEEESQGVRNDILKDFCKMLKRSGYDVEVRRKIIMRGHKGYGNLRSLDRRGIRRLHRRGIDTVTERYRKKLDGKTSWYKQVRKTDDKEETEEVETTNIRRKQSKEDETIYI